jgi:16S rRNA (guanine527-N7)-methyltransferase
MPKIQLDKFRIYLDLILEWNSHFNLTAIRKPEDIVTKHFIDSLSCLQAFTGRFPKSLADVGTGAGFPGIPLKIVLADCRVTLIESVQKKADFCRLVTRNLELKDMVVVSSRVEELGQEKGYRETYDWAVARAVAGMPVLAEYLLPLVKPGGWMLAQKSKSAIEEVHQAGEVYRVLGGSLEEVIPVSIPGVDEDRLLVVVKKIGQTPKEYPRRTGLPARSPL